MNDPIETYIRASDSVPVLGYAYEALSLLSDRVGRDFDISISLAMPTWSTRPHAGLAQHVIPFTGYQNSTHTE